MFAPFSLPSQPSKEITLREATTAETLSFCDVLQDHEEALTTRFLNTVQDKATFFDSRQWTADDRRLALFWYWLHTVQDTVENMNFKCPHCQKNHNHEFDMRDLASGYAQMKGLDSRDIEFQGRKLVIKHLTGEHLEHLENMRLIGNKSLKQQSEIKFYKLKSSILLADDHEKDSQIKESNLNNWLMNLEETKLTKLQKAVNSLLKDMKHGLPSQISNDGKISLLSPLHVCPTLADQGKEVTTELLLPFRNFYRIPRI